MVSAVRFSVCDVLFCAPDLDVQLVSAVAHALLWALMIRVVLPPLFIRYIRGMAQKTQFLKRFRSFCKANYFYDLGNDEQDQIEFAAEFQGIILQHGVSGFLALPSALGFGAYLPVGVASAMARQGGLCEVGWEVQDTLARLLQLVFGGQRGRAKNPPVLLIFLVLHHSCALSLVLPLNVHYPDDTDYHEGIMLLQIAAFFAFSAQMFSWTLDIKTQKGLSQMKIAVFLSWATIMWSRALRYAFVWYKLFGKFMAEEDPFLRNMAVAPIIGMSLVNIPIVLDNTRKLWKFSKMSLKAEDQASDSSIPAKSVKFSQQPPTLLFQLPDSLRPRHSLQAATSPAIKAI